MEYAGDFDELKTLWRKRLKLSALDGFASKSNIEDEKKNLIREIEEEARKSITDNEISSIQ